MTYDKKTENGNERLIYLDCLRILATFGVMLLHVSAQNWAVAEVNTLEWNVFNFFDSSVRWAVPVFVMISGALFLAGNRSIEQIYKRNVLRLITAWSFWSAAYAWIGLVTVPMSLKDAVLQMMSGHYHMWFLFMIIGLYMIVPFLQKIVGSLELTRYFLILSLMFTFLLPQLVMLFSFTLERGGAVVSGILNNFYFHFAVGFVGYFVCGYYLNNIEIKGRKEGLVYLLGICGLIMTAGFTRVISIRQQAANELFYGYFTVNVLLESIAVFVLAKNHFKWCMNKRIEACIRKFSKYSFGAYLVHAMVLEQLHHFFGIHTLSFHPIVSVIVIVSIVCVISFGISGMLNSIPVLKKYIV